MLDTRTHHTMKCAVLATIMQGAVQARHGVAGIARLRRIVTELCAQEDPQTFDSLDVRRRALATFYRESGASVTVPCSPGVLADLYAREVDTISERSPREKRALAKQLRAAPKRSISLTWFTAQYLLNNAIPNAVDVLNDQAACGRDCYPQAPGLLRGYHGFAQRVRRAFETGSAA